MIEFADFLKEERVTHGRGLDIGCAEGRHAVYLAKRGYAIQGIDLSALTIAKARNWVRKVRLDEHVGLVLSDVMCLPYAAGTFDFALDFGLFHFLHQPYRKRYLQSLIDVLKLDSYYLLTVFSSTNFANPLTKKLHTNHPAHCFTKRELEDALSPSSRPVQLAEWKKVEEDHFHWMLTATYHLVKK